MARSQAQPIQVRGKRLRRIGGVLFWGALIAFIASVMFARWLGTAGILAADAILFALLLSGISIMRHGRRVMAASGEELLARDPRDPVIYLRPFSADLLGTAVATRYLGWRVYTDEEQLALVLNEIGPFVAIGDPRETVAELGAARIYAREGNWQSKVADLVARARLVILRAGTSEGFWYELQAVHKSVSPRRVLLFAPADRASYEAFRERAQRVLPHPLAEWRAGGSHTLFGNIGALIQFDDNWRPTTLPVVKSMLRGPWSAPYVARLQLTLRPAFAGLGVGWKAPVVKRGRRALLIAASVIGILAALMWAAFELPYYLWSPDDSRSSSQHSASPAGISPYDAALAAMQKRIAESPEIKARLGAVDNGEQARQQGRDLSSHGFLRLSDARILEHFAIMSRALAAADLATCAAVVKGRSGISETLIRPLDAADIDAFFDLTYQAMLAEARQDPAPPRPSNEEIARSWRSLLGSVPEADATVLSAVMTDAANATDADACKSGRQLYSKLLELPEPDRAVLARALATPP